MGMVIYWPPGVFPNLEKGNLLFLNAGNTAQVRVISFDPK